MDTIPNFAQNPTIQSAGSGTWSQASTWNWSIMNAVWFTANASADLNNDGIMNSLDFSIMNSNWGR